MKDNTTKQEFVFESGVDYTCLGVRAVFPADFERTGISLNELIVGGTGSGKTTSIVVPRMLHTWNSSLVVPLAKRSICDTYAQLFRDRGYEVALIDLARPGRTSAASRCGVKEVGYDPMDYLNTPTDVCEFARKIVQGDGKGSSDAYWDNGSANVVTSIIEASRLMSAKQGVRPSLARALDLYRNMKVSYPGGKCETSLDFMFDRLEKEFPENMASRIWRTTIVGLSEKTASCVFSIVSGALDAYFSPDVLEVAKKEEHIDFRSLGEKKTVYFVLTSPISRCLQRFTALMYDDLLKELFDQAQGNENLCLNRPVHIIVDDLCGAKMAIPQYITIMRAAKISITMCIQSESMLRSTYSESDSLTIINNADSYVFLGGMDYATNMTIAQTLNVPFRKIREMPIGKAVVLRRGREALWTERYQTFSDPLYQEVTEKYKNTQMLEH